MCVCVCVCVCVYVCLCARALMRARTRTSTLGDSVFLFFFFQTVSFIEPAELTGHIDWLSNELQKSVVPVTPALGLHMLTSMPAFYMSTLDLISCSSGLCGSVQQTLYM